MLSHTCHHDNKNEFLIRMTPQTSSALSDTHRFHSSIANLQMYAASMSADG